MNKYTEFSNSAWIVKYFPRRWFRLIQLSYISFTVLRTFPDSTEKQI